MFLHSLETIRSLCVLRDNLWKGLSRDLPDTQLSRSIRHLDALIDDMKADRLEALIEGIRIPYSKACAADLDAYRARRKDRLRSLEMTAEASSHYDRPPETAHKKVEES